MQVRFREFFYFVSCLSIYVLLNLFASMLCLRCRLGWFPTRSRKQRRVTWFAKALLRDVYGKATGGKNGAASTRKALHFMLR